MAENSGTGGTGSPASTMRVMGRAEAQAGGASYGAYLLQADGGAAYIAADYQGELVIRSALTGEILDDEGLTRQVRIVVALHNVRDVAVTAGQDGEGIWCAQAVLAPGVAAVASAGDRQAAIDGCNDRLDVLVNQLRASA